MLWKPTVSTIEGKKIGHVACFKYLEDEVICLLTSIHIPDTDVEQYLLDQLSIVFSEVEINNVIES